MKKAGDSVTGRNEGGKMLTVWVSGSFKLISGSQEKGRVLVPSGLMMSRVGGE